MLERSKVVVWSAVGLSALVGLTSRFVGPAVAIGAPRQRQIEIPIVTKAMPVVVAKVAIGDATVQSARFAKAETELPDPITPFQAEDDWVRATTIYLLNRTNLSLTYVYITFTFPETRVGHEERLFPLVLGIKPQSAFFDKVYNPLGMPITNPPGAKPLLVGPGAMLAIQLGDYIEQITDRVGSYMPLSVLGEMHVAPQMFYFEGGRVVWNAGFRIFDADHNTWQTPRRGYFPGDMDSRLPGRPGWPGEQ